VLHCSFLHGVIYKNSMNISEIINMALFQMVLDCQLDAKYFHNKFMSQRYTKNIQKLLLK
jgi:hypothetical protein